jgi:hypothetical protein
MTPATPNPFIPTLPMPAFNINDYVYVRLTDEGRKILMQQHQHAPVEDPDGYSRWQLWHLMSVFGQHVYNGCRVPFETTIKIPPSALSNLPTTPHA